jgi:hypothetical protein
MAVSPSRHGNSAARSRQAARRFLSFMRQGKDLRRDLVRRVRERIAAGYYENDLKLEVALDRLARALRHE